MLKELCFLMLFLIVGLGIAVYGVNWMKKKQKKLAKEWMEK